MDEEAREQMVLTAVGDTSSAYYKGLVKLMRDCEANAERARMVVPVVVIPFSVSDLDLVELEQQFSVPVKVKGALMRAASTSRVAAMVHLLDAALVEHSMAGGRRVLLVDGDLMSVAATGIDGKLVERTYASARLCAGYFFEDEHLKRFSEGKAGSAGPASDRMLRELVEGGGDHYWPKLRLGGPPVDVVVVNHFKTPVGPRQVAWLAKSRGAIALGAFPFQVEMLVAARGRLACFPGWFYVDKVADTITLVPSADASMSISLPYSSLMEFIHHNSVTVGGVEYLCEKYMNLKGIMYYSLKPVECAFETTEVLRTSLYDVSSVGVTKIRYPKVKFSDEGVPVGWERGELDMLTSRVEKVLPRLMTSSSTVVRPSEAFTALMDYNNMVFNSLDTASLSDRMEVGDEDEVSVALALHVNWRRHAARGTFNVLMNAVKTRYAAKDVAVHKLAFIALAAWWTRPSVSKVVEEDIPCDKVVDWCGNDFSVTMGEVDPWIEIAEEVGLGLVHESRQYPWFPKVPEDPKDGWYVDLCRRAREFLATCGGKEYDTEDGGASGNRLETKSARGREEREEREQFKKKKNVSPCKAVVSSGGVSFSGAPVASVAVVVDQHSQLFVPKPVELTAVKTLLKKKMVADQGAVNERVPMEFHRVYGQMLTGGLCSVPVVDVDVVSAIQDDMNMVAGPLNRDMKTTGYRLAETDVDKNTRGTHAINDSKRAIPNARWVRCPKVDAGVEGVRAPSQAALLGAMYKRNVGIPSNRGTVNLDIVPAQAVSRVISVCYREDWEEILGKHLNTGMWEPNEECIEDFLGNIDERKVRTLLNEFFLEGFVNLEKWMLMIKGKIKPSREAGVEYKVDHAQTIMYLENSSTNAMYSAMVRRFKRCVDECLRPEVKLNAQESDEEHEIWYNSLEAVRKAKGRTYSYAADIHCYDRSQEHVGLRVDTEFYRRHGLGPERLKIWEQTHGPKRAVSMMFGVVLVMTLGGVSGIFKTLLRNGIINLASLVVSTGMLRKDVVMIDIKGDDLDLEVGRPVAVETAVESMSLVFNLSAKFFTNDVRYMCKQFRIRKNGWWYFMADPWARVQSLCTPVVVDGREDNMIERWISLKADLRNYDNGLLVDEAAEAAQVYYHLPKPVYGFARGLSKIAESRGDYFNFFLAPVLVS